MSGSSSTHCTNSSRLERRHAVSAVTRGPEARGASPVGPGGGRIPDAVWHLDVFVPVDLAGQLKFTVETPGGEETLQESVEQALVELIVHPAAVDGLSHQGLERRPGDLVWRDVLPSLGGGGGWSRPRQAATCTRVPPAPRHSPRLPWPCRPATCPLCRRPTAGQTPRIHTSSTTPGVRIVSALG